MDFDITISEALKAFFTPVAVLWIVFALSATAALAGARGLLNRAIAHLMGRGRIFLGSTTQVSALLCAGLTIAASSLWAIQNIG